MTATTPPVISQLVLFVSLVGPAIQFSNLITWVSFRVIVRL